MRFPAKRMRAGLKCLSRHFQSMCRAAKRLASSLQATSSIFVVCFLVQYLATDNFKIEVLAYFPTLDFFSMRNAMGLILYQFTHANWPHLLGNFSIGLPALWYTEHRVGARKTFNAFVLGGVGAALGHLCWAYCMSGGFLMFAGPLVGSSGSVFAIAIYALLLLSEKKEYTRIALACVALYATEQFLSALLAMSEPSNVAFWGHIGGIFTGLLMYAFRKTE